MKPHLAAISLLASTLAVLASAAPELTVRKLAYDHAGDAYAPVLVQPANAASSQLPGVLMVPNWMGVTDNAIAKASQVAAMGYTVYIADLYTAEVRPTNGQEAGAAAGAVRADRTLMRARTQAAFDHFRSLAAESGVPADNYAAIGFCFGGGAVLEFARSGAPLKAFVSFHGDLLSPTLAADSKNITGRILVLHGDIDPYVPPEHVNTWLTAMRTTSADYQFVSYSGAVHSFTDPTAKNPGQSEYHPLVAKRAFAAMHSLLQEAFAKTEVPGK
jgi:dienelactone hydrolase